LFSNCYSELHFYRSLPGTEVAEAEDGFGKRPRFDGPFDPHEAKTKTDLTRWRHQMKRGMKGILAVTLLAVFGYATLALAGFGHHGTMGTGKSSWGWDANWGHICGYGPGYGYSGNLTPDQVSRLDRMRTGFLKDTKALRQQLCADNLTLQKELGRRNPDRARISGLKSKISKLQAELDRRSADFDASMHRSVPGFKCSYHSVCPWMNASQ
jgi:zinc resistance-associated protein